MSAADALADQVPGKLEVKDVSRTFGPSSRGFMALGPIELTVASGEFLCIVGPSGCGKSTLLRMFAGLDSPSTGSIAIRHEDRTRPMTAMIFQQESVFPWLTVEENAAYGLKATRNWKGAESQDRVDYFLKKTGLYSFRKFRPDQLSGGMKQRLSIARAFATNPEILLMDEPFAALDEQNKLLMQQELASLWEEFRSTVIFITHGLDEAVLLGDRVVVMSSAPGRLIHSMQIDLPRPRHSAEIRRMPEFARYTSELWDILGQEVLEARRQETRRIERQAH
ncbi:ABC transporter ATP-binding protein [Rhizobium alvei]|uniref:ABC transporter ATP-binding protein n=1 Tax=Rhizobium alvei TaxID=1132659 RepID=A0ABT8YTK3_9HYPH|nr:ABC transporter ATP-binding protein [Rhizobium alvei]MDO6966684.1 ABC transporter ATP-binding protein [Rhizobium alvei]